MRPISNERGFSLSELLVSTTVTLAMMGAAITTVKHAMTINDTASQMSDANQNLRAGSNLLVADLLETGRAVPIGGIPIPSGDGAQPINRPAPPDLGPYYFDNVTSTTLPAITTGYQLGPTVDNSSTDMITMLMMDTLLPAASLAQGDVAPDGSTIALPAVSPWITGAIPGTAKTVAPIKPGDIVFFSGSTGNALRTVTKVDTTTVYFEDGASQDWFNFNQDTAAQGTLSALKTGGAWPSAGFSIQRLIMLTYYVDAVTTPGTPRLTRMQNHYGAQALAGIVEDLDITYDLVDGSINPVNVPSLPALIGNPALLYSSNQIRKVNLHIGVRSENESTASSDYIRNHVSTSVAVRDLSSVTRYF